MKAIQVMIPDRLLQEITKSGREPAEAIIEALNKYLDPSYQYLDLQRWQQHMEQKVQDLQHQLDEHISNSSKDIGKDFNNDLWQRKSGEKSPMALDTPTTKTSGERSLIGEVNKKNAPIPQLEVELPL